MPPFIYQPVKIKSSYRGDNTKGFKFPAGATFKDGTDNAADEENLRKFMEFWGINQTIFDLENLMQVNTARTRDASTP